MKNKILIMALISTALISLQIQSSESSYEPDLNSADTSKFEQVFILGLQGDLTATLKFLDTLSDSSLTQRQADIRQKIYSRYKQLNEDYKFISKDSTINKLIGIYLNYWRNALLDNSSFEKYDVELTREVTGFLRENYPEVSNASETDINEKFPQYLQDYLMTKRIFAATGKTGMFFDLLLHGKESEVIYEVTIPEEKINVKVVFMEDVISNGWEDYATFGKYYPGGWATSDALYCIKESYDLNSENFLVSYLKHEGKHFADYKLFPKLTGADLEYRAKLVELSAAKVNLYSLIKFFSMNSIYDKQNPHGFANFCVIRDLTKQLFGTEMETDIEKWKTISTDNINNAAAILLKQNTNNLKKAGAETVSEFIK